MNRTIITENGGEYTTITLRCKYGDLVFPCAKVGEVAHHLPEFEFVIHKSSTWEDNWTVSERDTGYAVVTRDSFDGAIAAATAKLATKTVEQVRAAVEKTVAMTVERDAFLATLARKP